MMPVAPSITGAEEPNVVNQSIRMSYPEVPALELTRRSMGPGTPLNFLSELGSLCFNSLSHGGYILTLPSLSQKAIVPRWQNRTTLLFLLSHPGAEHVFPLTCHLGNGATRCVTSPPSRLQALSLCQSQKTSSWGAGLLPVLRSPLLLTCCAPQHPHSTLSILATQLVFWICGLASAVSSGIFSVYTFKWPLPHFLLPHLLKLWLDISWPFSLYPLWLWISFIFPTYLSLWAVLWITSPTLSYRSQSLSLCAVWNRSTEFVILISFYFQTFLF